MESDKSPTTQRVENMADARSLDARFSSEVEKQPIGGMMPDVGKPDSQDSEAGFRVSRLLFNITWTRANDAATFR